MAGGLANGLTIAANTRYYLFALINEDKSAVDYGYDTDIEATNLLADENVVAAGFIYYRLIATIKTNDSSVIDNTTLNVYHTDYKGAFPSLLYDTLTVSTSGSYWTAPADGKIVFKRTATAAGQTVGLYVKDSLTSPTEYYGVEKHSYATGNVDTVVLDVFKGARVYYYYAGTATYARFIYPQGYKA